MAAVWAAAWAEWITDPLRVQENRTIANAAGTPSRRVLFFSRWAERRRRFLKIAASFEHRCLGESGVASLPAAVHDAPRNYAASANPVRVMDCAGKAQRRRRFRPPVGATSF